MLKPLPIERIKPLPLQDFCRLYVRQNRPVIIEGLLDSWPALTKWSLDYFLEYYGEVCTAGFRIAAGECKRGTLIDSLPMHISIPSIKKGIVDDGLAIFSDAESFPESLQEDFSTPVYCSDGSFLRRRIIIGPPYTVTGLHQDLFENIYTMVEGEKRITLFAPSDPVYPNPRLSKSPNYSQIDMEKPDYVRFPKFNKAQPYVVDLTKGETLYIPGMWWHHLRNLKTSIAISFWWAIGWKLGVVRAASIYKKLRMPKI